MSEEYQLYDTDHIEELYEGFTLHDTDLTSDLTKNENEKSGYEAPGNGWNILGKIQNYYIANTNYFIGKGTQSRVYHCKGEDGNEYVAKLYNKQKINRNKLLKVLEKLYNNKSKYITNIIEYGDTSISNNSCIYVIMPKYVPLSKEQYIFKGSTLDTAYEKRIIKFIEDVNEGLKYMHKHDIFHGDIKPDNIMWNPITDNAVIIDFGGSALSDETGKSITAAALTHSYVPNEVIGNHNINSWVDYYSFGVTLAELLNGIYPKNRRRVLEQMKEVVRIDYCYLPKSLPQHFQNLLEGLLFQSTDEDDIKSYRWIGTMVDTWLRQMRNGKYVEAGQINSVRTILSRLQSSSPNSYSGNGTEDSSDKIKFLDTIYLDIGGEIHQMRNLNDMADLFAKNWYQGKQIIADISPLTTEKTGFDVMMLIKNCSTDMEKAGDNQGNSSDAIYFKFLYKFKNDKQTFIWPALPRVSNEKEFAVRLLAVLNTILKQGEPYSFGEWWKSTPNNSKSEADVFAEIFSNKVFSTYLQASGETNERILKQCHTVENLFGKRENVHYANIVAQMYLLVYLICDINAYKLSEDIIFRHYSDFCKLMDSYAYDTNNATKALELWGKVSDKRSYKPDFYAWMLLDMGRKVGPIVHKSKM